MRADVTTTAERIAAIFTRIHHERMRDLPIVNPVLTVKALGFREVEQGWLGALVTPWLMNLVLLPYKPADWARLRTGTQIEHAFPAGSFMFTMGHEEGLGPYQSCSLFSPMFEFVDQTTAEATALAAIEALFMPLTDVPDSANATTPVPDGALSEPNTPETLEERLQRPMSRRELLRGLLPATHKGTEA